MKTAVNTWAGLDEDGNEHFPGTISLRTTVKTSGGPNVEKIEHLDGPKMAAVNTWADPDVDGYGHPGWAVKENYVHSGWP